ncbi:hypothetical protein ACFX19_028754 [Malus domestica]
MAGHASSERWIETDGAREREGEEGVGISAPLLQILDFMRVGEGGQSEKSMGGLQDSQTPQERHRRSRLRRLTPHFSVSGIDRSIRRGSTVLKWYLDW